MDECLSVRESERLVKKILNSGNKVDEPEKKEDSNISPMIDHYEERMKDILGTKVKIKNRNNNKGKIEIDYYSAIELERIIDMIQSIKN